MSKPSPITLTVTQTSTITPNMQRITLSGEGLSKYPTECAGGYIKLLFLATRHHRFKSTERR